MIDISTEPASVAKKTGWDHQGGRVKREGEKRKLSDLIRQFFFYPGGNSFKRKERIRMATRKKVTGRARSIPAGLTTGAAASLVLTVILSAILGKCMETNQISQENIGYWVIIQIFTITFLSGILCTKIVKHRKMLLCLLSGLIYWGILLSITALFFGGQYEAVWETAAVICAGSLFAGLVSGIQIGQGKGRKKRPLCG